ncbi:RSP_2648 family PIN domain-containing protein [Amaricoccus macauensis]|uniref:RSP_2648 family PIN domain-containing protein n=1 Tax=Amaricoccus macauensis TaxID=57001 RepID=UPI003C7C3A5A
MRACLDACVLFPSVMREMLLSTANDGGFEPVWSERILEEWARATRRLPEGAEAFAREEIAAMQAHWPDAMADVREEQLQAIALPDPDDAHVVAAALAGAADVIVTSNRKDFPNRALSRHGVIPRDPDGFLLEIHLTELDLRGVAARVRERAEYVSGREQPLRALLKRAGMPRLGKALASS